MEIGEAITLQGNIEDFFFFFIAIEAYDVRKMSRVEMTFSAVCVLGGREGRKKRGKNWVDATRILTEPGWRAICERF